MLVYLVYVCMILHLIRNLFQRELSLLVASSMLQEFCKPVVRVHMALVLGLSTFDCTDLLWFSFLIYLACILLNLINKVTTVANASCALQDIGFCIAKIVRITITKNLKELVWFHWSQPHKTCVFFNFIISHCVYLVSLIIWFNLFSIELSLYQKESQYWIDV